MRDPNVLEVVEEVVDLGKEKVETGRLRIYNVVSESKDSKSIPLVDETVTETVRRADVRAERGDAGQPSIRGPQGPLFLPDSECSAARCEPCWVPARPLPTILPSCLHSPPPPAPGVPP